MLNKASTLANGVDKLERLAESAIEVEGAYTDRGDALEAGVPLSVSVGEAHEDVLWGGGDGRVCSPVAITRENPTKDVQKEIDRYDRVVGWRPLKDLLQPRHPFFKGKAAYLDDFAVYRHPDAENWLVWPRIAGPRGGRMPLGNPYRLRRISRSHTARKIKALFAVADEFKVRLRLAHIVSTCPEPISRWAVEKQSRRQVMWKELGRAFLEGLGDILGPGLGADTNYHTWSSECPLKPHSHFHNLVANLRVVESGTLDEDDEPAYSMVEIPWHRQRGGKDVPLADQQLIDVKNLWWRLLAAFVKKHHIDWDPGTAEEGWKGVNVWVEPRDTKAAMMGTINYVGRNPLEDFAVYSNAYHRWSARCPLARYLKAPADCPDPPGWLLKYTNKSRPFGWWRSLKTLAGSQTEEREKLHPLTGERLEYLGKCSLLGLLEHNHGQLGFLDVVKGRPVFSALRWDELDWLRSVVKSRAPPWRDDDE